MAAAKPEKPNTKRRTSVVQLPPSDAGKSPQSAGVAPESKPLIALLNLESQVRSCENEHELVYLIANETRKLVRARQVFVIDGDSKHLKVVGISSLDSVDRNVPLVRWIEHVILNLKKQDGTHAAREFMLPAYCGDNEADISTYPFPNMLWIPFRLKSGRVIGGMLLTREQPWGEADTAVANRLANAYAFALIFQRTARPKKAFGAKRRLWPWAAGVLAVAVQFVPVPLVVHAPVEVAPRNAFIVAAPIDGVVSEITAEPSSRVAQGDIIVRIEDTKLRNALALAEEDLQVAETRLRQISQASFYDLEARSELRLTSAERDLKQAERDYAAQLLDRATIRASRDGLAIFSNRNDWRGRPVRTGERIMSIADPGSFEFIVELPVADSIVLDEAATVKIFLNTDPLKPIDARLQSTAYEASMSQANILSYRLTARLQDPDIRRFRLGSRGTAQIFGPKVPLFYYLFRRPLSSLRNAIAF